MPDLLTRLREYGNQLDSQATSLEDLTPKRHVPARVKVRWRGPLIALDTAAAVVLTALGVA